VTSSVSSIAALRQVISTHWGFDTLRPLQEQAMAAVLAGRDSLLVLPTGGGKSLCYQAPALLDGGITVVVSPLIALMKDQVDALRANDVPAIQIDSSQSPDVRAATEREILEGRIRLLFVSPERLMFPSFQGLLRRMAVKAFAIDEAHCISHWGHDFRPEYRQLRQLKQLFPRASVHGYTATATEQVREDIAEQLGLGDPLILVGNFDRANLTYRVLPRRELSQQVFKVLDRHRDEAGIIYCIRRIDVEDLAEVMKRRGIRAFPYHAGMSAEVRRATQEAFSKGECDVIVATVAFGMGIDRSNIRFVLHTAMPKSVEHYQQETGRAGRDGLEAECVLLHSGADFLSWRSILENSAAEPGVDPAFLPSALKHLEDMDRYCRGAVCRHKALVEYFGQRHEATACSACDLCLEDVRNVPEALIVAQKILSCVARLKERFGIGQVAGVRSHEGAAHGAPASAGAPQEGQGVQRRSRLLGRRGPRAIRQLAGPAAAFGQAA
jgi:ATP-dependent DNA helicase RecQ